MIENSRFFHNLNLQHIFELFSTRDEAAKRFRGIKPLGKSVVMEHEELMLLHTLIRTNPQISPSFHRNFKAKLAPYFNYPYSGKIRTGPNWVEKPEEELRIGLPSSGYDLKDPIVRFYSKLLQNRQLLKPCGSGEPIPDLVECQRSEDASHWFVRVRDDAFWSDGQPITSLDVIRTIRESNIYQKKDGIERLEAVDVKTVELWLGAKYPFFPNLLAGAVVETQNNNGIVSGSYRIDRIEGRSIVLLRVAPGMGNIKTIVLKCHHLLSHCLSELTRGELDVVVAHMPAHFSNDGDFCSQPLLCNSYEVQIILNRRNGMFSHRANCEKLREIIPYDIIKDSLIRGQVPEGIKDKRLMPFTMEYEAFDDLSRIAQIIGKTLGASLISTNQDKGLPNSDAFLSQLFFSPQFERLYRFFAKDGLANIFKYSSPETDEMFPELLKQEDYYASVSKGQLLYGALERDFAFIPIATTFNYLLSPLEFCLTPGLESINDIVSQMGRLIIERF